MGLLPSVAASQERLRVLIVLEGRSSHTTRCDRRSVEAVSLVTTGRLTMLLPVTGLRADLTTIRTLRSVIRCALISGVFFREIGELLKLEVLFRASMRVARARARSNSINNIAVKAPGR